jgi:hypothetical protein
MRRLPILVVLFGLWLALSPWFAAYARHAHAMQDSIVGVLVVIAGSASAFVRLTTGLPLWIAFALGLCTALTPMMFGQVGESFSANNDLILGPLIALSASITIVGRARALLRTGPPDPEGAKGQASLW